MLLSLLRQIALVAVLTVGGLPLHAQQLLVEARGGPNRSRLTMDQWTPGTRHGAVAGLSLDLAVRSWLAVRSELQYVDAGATGPGEFEMRLGYVTAPVSVRLAWPRALAGLQPYVLAGVVPSREVRCGGRTSPTTVQIVAPSPAAIPLDCASHRTERRDVGRTVGVGTYFGSGRLRYSAEVRAIRGLHNIASGYRTALTYNRYVSVIGGVAWRLR